MGAFVRACAINPHFCVNAVARRDLGSAENNEIAWRCYSVKELDRIAGITDEVMRRMISKAH